MPEIWIVNHYAISPDLPGGTRHFDFACELVKKGYRVKIFACDIILGKNKEHAKLEEKESYSVENIKGVEFIWVRAATYERNNWRRAWNMLTFSYNCYKIGCKFKDKPEVIIGSSPHPFAAFAAAKLAQKMKVRFFLELRDLWPQALIDIGKFNEYHPFIKLMRLLEKYLYKSANKIIVLAEGSIDYLKKEWEVSEYKILYLPNGVHLDNFSCKKDREILRKHYNFGKFTLIYTGAHGPSNALDTILKAADRLEKNKEIEIVLVGDGIVKKKLIEQAREMRLNNVRFLRPIPKAEIPKILMAADAAIFTLKKTKVHSYAISPNKVFDYMAAQKPIICAVEGVIAKKVDKFRCGITVPAENDKLLAETIIKLKNTSKPELRRMGKNGYKEILKNYSRVKLAKKLIASFQNIN
jgi:glycosyltransferase involved in cell wall biosynthesis